MNETEKLKSLYRCKVELTGETIYMLKPGVFDPRFPFTPKPPYHMDHPDVHHSEKEVAIKMPESEYQRFISDYNQFMSILTTISDNPQIRDQYHQLLILVNLLK